MTGSWRDGMISAGKKLEINPERDEQGIYKLYQLRGCFIIVAGIFSRRFAWH